MSVHLTQAIADRKSHQEKKAVTTVRKRSASKFDTHTSDDAVTKAYGKQCCEKLCVRSFLWKDVKSCRIQYFSQTERDRMFWLLDRLRERGAEQHYRVRNHIVCRTAFQTIYGISKRKLDTALHYIKSDTKPPPHGNIGHNNSPQTDRCFAWLSHEFLLRCDKIRDDLWLLPEYTTDQDLYDDFCQALKLRTDSEPIPGKSTFSQVRVTSFSHVRVPKKGDLSRCDTCSRIRLKRAALKTDDEVDDLEAEMRAHAQEHRSERLAMMEAIERAVLQPKQVFLLTIDYTKAAYLPTIRPPPKSLESGIAMEVMIGGAIEYSSEQRWLFVHPNNWSKGPDLVTSICFELIRRSKQSTHPSATAPVMHLYVDNTPAEFKNRWFFGFCAWLVRVRWFDEVLVSMLEVGHTHSAIDQMFSTMHHAKERHSTVTPTDLVKTMHSAYTSGARRPTIALLEHCDEWKAWLSPQLANYSGHSVPHHFRFRRTADNVSIETKRYAKDDWAGEKGAVGTAPALVFLTVDSVGHPTPKSCDRTGQKFSLSPSASISDNARSELQRCHETGMIERKLSDASGGAIVRASDGSDTHVQVFSAPSSYLPPPRAALASATASASANSVRKGIKQASLRALPASTTKRKRSNTSSAVSATKKDKSNAAQTIAESDSDAQSDAESQSRSKSESQSGNEQTPSSASDKVKSAASVENSTAQRTRTKPSVTFELKPMTREEYEDQKSRGMFPCGNCVKTYFSQRVLDAHLTKANHISAEALLNKRVRTNPPPKQL